ncbi:MAG TPA: hypothetical protein VIJ10_16145 [Vicinamibacteria bacterium]|jgi:uncharacterized membrane protein YvlD (DUF360 family)
MPVATTEWFNTARYPVPLLVLFGVGCFGWVVAYVAIVRNALRNRFLEIPAGAVVANIAWEFVWGFLYPNELGRFFSWGYRIWFFFDLGIVYMLFRYGDKQVELPELKAIFRPACVFGIAAWAVAIYFFVGEGYDTGYGAISGYILNTMMSALYVVIVLRHGHLVDFSLVVAWSKMLGTALLTVFNFLVQPGNPYLLLLCLLTLALDLLYIGLFYAIRSGRAGALEAATREGAA